MIETPLRLPKELSVRSNTKIKTPIGNIREYVVDYKGTRDTIYSPKGHNFFSLKTQAEMIQSTKKMVKSESVINKCVEQNTTPQQLIEEKSRKYSEDLKNNIHRDEIEYNEFFPVIETNALKIIFQEAKNAS